MRAPVMDILRAVFWFDEGELDSIWSQITPLKWGYEARWESEVLAVFVFGIIFAFMLATWLGILFIFTCKIGIQALHKKRFFENIPMPPRKLPDTGN